MSSVDLSKVSAAELKAALKKKTKAQAQERKEKEEEYLRIRNAYMDTVFGTMEKLSPELIEFKTQSIARGLEVHALMYDVYDREKRELDSYTLTDDNGLRKLVIERQHVCQYDETAEVAVGIIQQVMKDRFSGRNKGMYNILNDLLIKNDAGDYDEKMVARLRKHQEEVSDPRFIEALDLLAAAYKPVGSRMYIRAYSRPTKASKWQEKVMNWSSM